MREPGKDSEVVCDGYLPLPDKELVRKKPRAAQTHSRNDCHSVVPLSVPTCLNPDTFRDDSGTPFFHHFRTSTITDLALSPYSTRFWDWHILPLGNAVPAVRHAATALGIAHRAFLLESHNLTHPGEKKRLEWLAVQQYNKAIRQLLPHISSGGPMDVRVIVTCSLLFYCLENTRGHSAESIQHLRAGSRLVLSLPPHASAESRASGSNSDDTITEISSLFARLGVEASLYSEDEVVPNLRSYMAPVSNSPDDPLQPFPDLTLARNSLSDIDIDLSAYNNKGFVLARNGQLDLSVGENSHPSAPVDGSEQSPAVSSDGSYHGPFQELELQNIISRFRCWRRRFNRTVEEAEKRGPTKRERQKIMMLVLRQRVWETMLDEVPHGDSMQADRILDQAELAVRSFSSEHPIFTLESNIMSSTSFVCCYSTDDRHRRRALDILRSARMREGVWDSFKLASMLESAFPELKLHATTSTA